MDLIALIPGLICLIAIVRDGTKWALHYVLLPTILLGPMYYFLIRRPLPNISPVESALLVMGAGMVLHDVRRWRFSRADLWMLIFLYSSWYADDFFDHSTDAIFSLFTALLTGLVPYMVGKLLIEQTGSRISFSRMFALIMAGSSIFSAYEYVGKSNPYNRIYGHFFPGQWGGFTQLRWGFGRVGGPFGQSELAGMIVFTALLLAMWLGHNNFQERAARTPPPPLLKRPKTIIGILLVAQFLTQARGPWIGAGLAIAIASIGRARRPLRHCLIVTFCIVGIGLPAYTYGKDYLSGPRTEFGSEKETAQYRAELIGNYIPLAIQGGAWGWGQGFPRIGGQDSIDNEYLWVCILQGFVGLGMLVLLMGETMLVFVVQGIRARTVRDRHFMFTMLGIMVGLAFTLTTVFMGNQSYVLVFLLAGWAQGMDGTLLETKKISNAEFYQLVPDTASSGVFT